jgi:hypothetical protein
VQHLSRLSTGRPAAPNRGVHFVSKMKRMEEEADESALWLALLSATGIPGKLESECRSLENDFGEFTAIAVASVKTARQGAAR